MTTQLQQRQAAAQNRQQFASVNKGRPTMVAEAKPVPAGKPIAPIVPARPAPAGQPEPARSPPNRAAEPVPGRPTAPTPRPLMNDHERQYSLKAQPQDPAGRRHPHRGLLPRP